MHPHWPPPPLLPRSTGRGGIFSILLDKKTIYYHFETRLVPGPLTLASSSSDLLARDVIGAPPLARNASRELWSVDARVIPGQPSSGASTRHASAPLWASVSTPVNEALLNNGPGVSTIARKLGQNLQLYQGARDSRRARRWSGICPRDPGLESTARSTCRNLEEALNPDSGGLP